MVTPLHCLSDLSSVVQLRSDLSQNSPCWWLCNEWCGVFDHTGVLIKPLRLCGLLFLLNGIPVSGFHQSTEGVRVRKREEEGEREREKERGRKREKDSLTVFLTQKHWVIKIEFIWSLYKKCFEFPFQPTIYVRYRFWIWLYVSGISFHILPFIKLLTRDRLFQSSRCLSRIEIILHKRAMWYCVVLYDTQISSVKVTLSHIKKIHEMPCPKLDHADFMTYFATFNVSADCGNILGCGGRYSWR